ncbi:MAG: hypothetical protein WBB74_03045 [Gaiellaceae bacterium]
MIALLSNATGRAVREATNGHHENETERPAIVVADAPRGRAAIRLIVRERPGIWTLEQLRSEMKQRGWFTSDKGVEAVAAREVPMPISNRRSRMATRLQRFANLS